MRINGHPSRQPPRNITLGETVRTPTGRPAVVVEIHHQEREATVQWFDDGERARFRWEVLK